MKILQVVPYFPPAYAFGGPVNVAYQMSNELTKNGHKVVVYTSNVKDINYRLCIEQVRIIDGIEVHYMKYLNLIPIKKLKSNNKQASKRRCRTSSAWPLK